MELKVEENKNSRAHIQRKKFSVYHSLSDISRMDKIPKPGQHQEVDEEF